MRDTDLAELVQPALRLLNLPDPVGCPRVSSSQSVLERLEPRIQINNS